MPHASVNSLPLEPPRAADFILPGASGRTTPFVEIVSTGPETARHNEHLGAPEPAQCIGHRFASGLIAIREFERGRKTFRLAPAGCVVATSSDIEVAAAVARLGLIHTSEEILQPAFDGGQLVPILDDRTGSFPGPPLYYPSRRQMPPKLRAFVDFLREEAQAAL
jgi:DNA-binding transcriptional LysR family regulator